MKAIARLTQLLLFTAGPKLKHDLLRGDTVNIYRYGNFPVYQSDWVYYRALMALASQAPGELCTATTAQIIRLANKPNNQSTRNTVQNLMSSLTGTYLVIKRNGQISVSSALVDHFSSSLSLRNKEIHFLINPVILNFWQSGQWDDKDDQCRISIGSSDLALWIYALFTAKECSVSPEFGILYDMSGLKIAKKSNFLQHIRSALMIIQKQLTTFNIKIARNKNQQYILAIHR